MSANPDLEFKRLEPEDGELVNELAAALRSVAEHKAEYFGLGDRSSMSADGEVWGLYIRGILCGAAWYSPAKGGIARIRALALGKEWWKSGLTAWMFQQLAKATELSGGIGTVVELDEPMPAVGEALEDAEFIGPDRHDDMWPCGEWKRMTGWRA